MRYRYRGSGHDLEIRILELEDTVSSLTSILGSLSELIGSVYKITQVQTEMMTMMIGLPSASRGRDEEQVSPRVP